MDNQTRPALAKLGWEKYESVTFHLWVRHQDIECDYGVAAVSDSIMALVEFDDGHMDYVNGRDITFTDRDEPARFDPADAL